MTEALFLGFGLRFEDLYCRDGLLRLDRCFVDVLETRNPDLHDRLMAARAAPEQFAGKPESDLIIALAPELEDFIAELFGIVREVRALQLRHAGAGAALLREAAVRAAPRRQEIRSGSGRAFRRACIAPGARAAARRRAHGVAFCRAGRRLDEGRGRQRRRARHRRPLRRLGNAHARRPAPARRAACCSSCRARSIRIIWFRSKPRSSKASRCSALPPAHRRARDGFALTDPGTDLTGALDQANYCIWCHNQGKDSCSKGLKEKTGEFKNSAFGVVLAGCPLDQKISEMNLVAAGGHTRRRAGDRRRRQPDVRGHRPSHLQRLHESLHLSEAGTGRHSPGRDPRAQGGAGAALGLRDLLAADAMESARSAPAAAEDRHPAARCWWSGSVLPASRWRIIS